jgi:hypothetical protein
MNKLLHNKKACLESRSRHALGMCIIYFVNASSTDQPSL